MIVTIESLVPPPVGEVDQIRLQYARKNSDEWTTLDERVVVGEPEGWKPQDFTIPSTFLVSAENEGAFELRYEHLHWAGNDSISPSVRIHIDKVPPNGAFAPERMVFDFSSPITDATFGEHDYLEARIPPWAGDQVDVQVKFAWLKAELPEGPGDVVQIGPFPITPYGTVRIPKAQVIAAGNGRCCGIYVLIDKAGNISRYSKYQLMDVALNQ
ncbi:hypothetical protein [Pseudomonas endophytica]|uniref:hypothetical protein n=1 Tax=Pseudomonas endophytica TaxID=1563157 RepID=UPI0012E10957|nr:hypothetical protein [Pseudomonas endophytica]